MASLFAGQPILCGPTCQNLEVENLNSYRSILAKTIFLYCTEDTLHIQLYMYFEHFNKLILEGLQSLIFLFLSLWSNENSKVPNALYL